MNKSIAAICLLFNSLTMTAYAQTTNPSGAEKIASGELNKLIASNVDIKVGERVQYSGQTPDGQACTVELSKTKHVVGKVNSDEYAFYGESVNIRYFERGSSEPNALVQIFYKGSHDQYASFYSYSPTEKVQVSTEPFGIRLITETLYVHPDEKGTVQIAIKGMKNNRIDQVKAQVKYDSTGFSGLVEKLNPLRKKPVQMVCQNLQALGKKKFDYNLSANIWPDTDLHTFCGTLYSQICPSVATYEMLPDSMKNLKVCETFEEFKNLGKITDATDPWLTKKCQQ